MVADNQVQERQSRCGPLNVRYRPPNDMARPLLAATAAGVAFQPESPRCRAPAPGGAARSGKMGNCNGFFDPGRALLQRHETVIGAEVRRIGPALVFERLWEKEIGCRPPLNSSWRLQATPSCPLLFCKDWPVQSFFADYMYASLGDPEE
jgi:hypothetical protein